MVCQWHRDPQRGCTEEDCCKTSCPPITPASGAQQAYVLAERGAPGREYRHQEAGSGTEQFGELGCQLAIGRSDNQRKTATGRDKQWCSRALRLAIAVCRTFAVLANSSVGRVPATEALGSRIRSGKEAVQAPRRRVLARQVDTVMEMARALHIYVGRTVAQAWSARLDAGTRPWRRSGEAEAFMLAQQGRRPDRFQAWERKP